MRLDKCIKTNRSLYLTIRVVFPNAVIHMHTKMFQSNSSEHRLLLVPLVSALSFQYGMKNSPTSMALPTEANKVTV